MKRITMFVFVLLLSLLVACGRDNDETYVEEICNISEEMPHYAPEYPPDYIPDYIPEPWQPSLDDVFSSGRTRAEYLYDLDFFYTTLLENFPLFGAIYRRHGADLHTRYANARTRVETRENITDEIFMSILHDITAGARNIGHLSILFEDAAARYFVQAYSHLIAQGALEMQPFLDEFNNPATRAFYNLTDEDFIPPAEGVESAVYASVSNNIQTRIIEENRIAYVNILSMNFATMEIDRVTLLDFFHLVADYDHLIVDIRQNPGGTGMFFRELVISPNISYPLYFSNYMFFMGGEHNRRLLASWFGFEDGGIRPIDHNVIAHMPYFRQDNIYMFNYFRHQSIHIEPSYDIGIFTGKIWLLVDPRTFSAAELATAVTKQTGFATIVGHRTGGGGLGMTPLVLALPNTGVVLRYAAGYGVDEYGRENYEHGTQPHYFNRPGLDALGTVLAMIREGSY